MKNCPDDQYDRCRYAQIKCQVCCAGQGGPQNKMWWSPHPDDPNIDHPYRRDKARAKRYRESQAAEKRSRTLVAIATRGSGNRNHDGDNLICGNLREEVKLRGPRGPLGITRAEWQKGRKQGIDVFGIHFEDPDSGKQHALFCLTESAYSELIRCYEKQNRSGL